METWVLVLAILVAVGAPFLSFFVWLKVFDGPDGERLQKLRMQGPFVPLSETEVEMDDERVRARHAKKENG